MATAGELKLAVEASRAALIAVHAAAGLTRGQKQALRLLRAAEGLCRSAVAVIQGTVSDYSTHAAAAAGDGSGAPRRSRRQRAKRGKHNDVIVEGDLKLGGEQHNDEGNLVESATVEQVTIAVVSPRPVQHCTSLDAAAVPAQAAQAAAGGGAAASSCSEVERGYAVQSVNKSKETEFPGGKRCVPKPKGWSDSSGSDWSEDERKT